jgi:hypothetical protein
MKRCRLPNQPANGFLIAPVSDLGSTSTGDTTLYIAKMNVDGSEEGGAVPSGPCLTPGSIKPWPKLPGKPAH